MKQILYKLTLVMAAMFATITVSAYDFEVDGIYYNLDVNSKTASVTYKTYLEPTYEGNIVIPAEVTYLGNEIPVTTIGYSAFYRCSISTVSLPSTIEVVGNSAFSDCSHLEYIDLPESLEEIGESAFKNCVSLLSIEIPQKIKKLGEDSFRGCSNLEQVLIPDSIEYLPSYMFSSCKKLKSIKLPQKLIQIGSRAFETCVALENILFNDDLNLIGMGAFSGCTNLKSISLPNSVYQIGSEAFKNCRNIEEIILPQQIEEIEFGLFSGCSKLKSITIQQNVKTISPYAFSDCDSLYDLSIPASVTSIDSNAFNQTFFKTLVFEDSHNSISIPNYISSSNSGKNYYYNCKLPSTITNLYIGRNIDLYKPSTVSYSPGSPENDPFYPCSNLNNITVGPNVTDLSALNSTRYQDLDSLVLFCSVPPTIKPFSANQYLKVKVCVPIGSVDLYSTTEVWKDFWNIEGFENSGITAESITLSMEKVELNIGETIQLEAKILPEDTTDKTIEWSSFNEEVASVDASGLVTAIGEGTTIITATCGVACAQCEITVLEDNGVEGLFANPDNKISIYSIDGTIIKKDCNPEDLRTLVKGIYIVTSGEKQYKVLI